mmetsp:Transcript_7251/g.26674  ORF Transcript_7251/g.26674 Transcript_7251/m.26674 type:complete len:188 (-) Transcript_7251:1901-2464(-)
MLEGGEVLEDIDCIVYCTGYHYRFPFLKDAGAVTVDDNRVAPLYEHLFTPRFGATLSFIGLPFKVVPFPMMQLQSRWVAQALSGRVILPLEEEMTNACQEFYNKLERDGVPMRYTHRMGDDQFHYNDMISKITNSRPLPAWRKAMYEANSKNKRSRPEEYRDVWDDHDILQEALEQMAGEALFSTAS